MAEPSAPSRLAGARAHASARVEAAEDRSAAVRTLLTMVRHDRRVAGSILAGALAYRLFGALLPLALLTAVVLGWAGGEDDQGLRGLTDDVGLNGTVIASVSDSARLEESQRWTLLALGIGTLLISSYVAVKAIRAAYALVWGVPIERWRRGLASSLLLIVAVLVVLAVWGVSGWARHSFGFAGTVVTICAFAGFFLVCFGASWLLPHGPASWRALIPGALLLAAGLQVMHLSTTLWLAGKIERASATYGTIGAAFAILAWLYLISRLIVGAAVLNATLVRDRQDRGASRSPAALRG